MITLIRFLLGLMLVLTSLFLILLVLIQRGRGGGLTARSAARGARAQFGTKAGDVFTKITVGVAAFWIGLCIVAINVLGRQQSLFSPGLGGAAPQAVAPQTPPGSAASAPAPAGSATAPGDAAITLPAGEAEGPATPPASPPAAASPAASPPPDPAAPAAE